MLSVAQNILRKAGRFSTLRHNAKKASQKRRLAETPLEGDALKAYRHQVEKGSILRQFREEVFRRSQLKEDWEDTLKRDER